jgi:hypothetical protein
VVYNMLIGYHVFLLVMYNGQHKISGYIESSFDCNDSDEPGPKLDLLCDKAELELFNLVKCFNQYIHLHACPV